MAEKVWTVEKLGSASQAKASCGYPSQGISAKIQEMHNECIEHSILHQLKLHVLAGNSNRCIPCAINIPLHHMRVSLDRPEVFILKTHLRGMALTRLTIGPKYPQRVDAEPDMHNNASDYAAASRCLSASRFRMTDSGGRAPSSTLQLQSYVWCVPTQVIPTWKKLAQPQSHHRKDPDGWCLGPCHSRI
jgi:hypothetical protein